MAFLKNMIIGSDAPDPVLAPTVNPLDTNEGAQTFYQSQAALQQQQQFLQALQSQNGIGNQSQVFDQQKALAGQMQGVVNGTGPNPALAQFNQATGQNIAAQGALMAGQRGTQANAGLLARQIAQQGGNIQQQAAGQAATMQAQQQLAAMSALQAQQNSMAANANSMVGQQAQATGAYNQAALNNQQLALGAYGAQNTALASSQNSVNAANASQYAADNAIGASLVGGLASGLGSGLVGAGSKAAAAGVGAGVAGAAAASAPVLKYNGGMIEGYSDGGAVSGGPQSFTARFLIGGAQPMQSPTMAATGGPIQGQAVMPGDHPANDTVPAMLSPKEIVIPRSITMGADAPDRAAQFVAQVLGRQNLKRS